MFTLLSDQVKKFLSNPVLLACISSWFCAQFIKTVISILYGRIHSLYELVENLIWKTGGLPSSHSALVASLSTTVGFRNGISILSLCFFMVTIRDAVGVRRSNGIQAQKINEIGRLLNKKDIIDYKPIREVNGHTPMEVTIGCLLGFFIGLAFSLF